MKNLLFTTMLLALGILGYGQCAPTTYTEPQFTIGVQNPACPVQSEIRVLSFSGGVQPFQYTLLPNNITNTTGLFSGVAAGNYTVELKDACGTIRTRQATVTPDRISATSTVTSLGCNNFQFGITASAASMDLDYGYSLDGGQTVVWGVGPSFQLTLTPRVHLYMYVRDSCGNQAFTEQVVTKEMGGYIKVLNERIECFDQSIYPEYYGFDSGSQVCLYKSPQNTLVECKTVPSNNYNGGPLTNFSSLPFGQDWYVIVQNACYRDSMFFKDKTSAGGSELNPFAWKCDGFDIHVDGNGYDTVCLYSAATNQLVGCKPYITTSINPNTGTPWPYGGAEWYDLPYGTYYAYILDPCANMVVRIDSTVVYPRSFRAELHLVCTVFETVISSYFDAQTPLPHTTTVIYPNGTTAATYSTSTYYPKYDVAYPTFQTAGTVTVIQRDGCGRTDTSEFHQPMVLPVRTIDLRGGCPGIAGISGGGDLILRGDRHSYGGNGNSAGIAAVSIVRKDGNMVNIPSTYTQWNASTQQQEYFFTNLSTGTYIIESDIGCEHRKVYDTAIVRPYVYPTQDQPHIYQCGRNPYVFRDTVTGGVAPYTYEVLATLPALSSLLTGPQSSNMFTIPPGTSLNAITMRVVDACGNSNIKVFPVNHLGPCNPLFVNNTPNNQPIVSKPIKVYPNPSFKEFSIEISQRQRQDYQIDIYNSSAALVHTQILRGVDRRTTPIREPLQRGIYSIVITELKSGKRFIIKQAVL